MSQRRPDASRIKASGAPGNNLKALLIHVYHEYTHILARLMTITEGARPPTPGTNVLCIHGRAFIKVNYGRGTAPSFRPRAYSLCRVTAIQSPGGCVPLFAAGTVREPVIQAAEAVSVRLTIRDHA